MRLMLFVTIAGLFMWTVPVPAQGPKLAKPEKIGLWNNRASLGDGKFQETEVWISVHRPEKPNGTAIVICPGGGYGGLVTRREGTDRRLAESARHHRRRPGISFARGPIACAASRCPAGHSHGPGQRKGMGSSIRERIGIMGFSAGGHLASTAGTHFDAGEPDSTDPIERVSCRPDFMILVYPVISMGHKDTAARRNNLLGKNPDAKLVDLFSNEKQVTAKTPPTFLAHAKDDRPCRRKTARCSTTPSRPRRCRPSIWNCPPAATA